VWNPVVIVLWPAQHLVSTATLDIDVVLQKVDDSKAASPLFAMDPETVRENIECQARSLLPTLNAPSAGIDGIIGSSILTCIRFIGADGVKRILARAR
jgi:hypothetical protein